MSPYRSRRCSGAADGDHITRGDVLDRGRIGLRELGAPVRRDLHDVAAGVGHVDVGSVDELDRPGDGRPPPAPPPNPPNPAPPPKRPPPPPAPPVAPVAPLAPLAPDAPPAAAKRTPRPDPPRSRSCSRGLRAFAAGHRRRSPPHQQTRPRGRTSAHGRAGAAGDGTRARRPRRRTAAPGDRSSKVPRSLQSLLDQTWARHS